MFITLSVQVLFLGGFQGVYSLQGVKKIYSLGNNKDRNGTKEKLNVSVRQQWE